MTTSIAERIRPGRMPIRDVSLFVDVVGHGYPLVLTHGGPGLDHWSLQSFRRCVDQFTLIFYDHRCNRRSTGAPVSSMTWENLTADADALRERLGADRPPGRVTRTISTRLARGRARNSAPAR